VSLAVVARFAGLSAFGVLACFVLVSLVLVVVLRMMLAFRFGAFFLAASLRMFAGMMPFVMMSPCIFLFFGINDFFVAKGFVTHAQVFCPQRHGGFGRFRFFFFCECDVAQGNEHDSYKQDQLFHGWFYLSIIEDDSKSSF
jgi:hypothetical protein